MKCKKVPKKSENESGTVAFSPLLDSRRMKDEELFVACLLRSRYFAFTWVRTFSLVTSRKDWQELLLVGKTGRRCSVVTSRKDWQDMTHHTWRWLREGWLVKMMKVCDPPRPLLCP